MNETIIIQMSASEIIKPAKHSLCFKNIKFVPAAAEVVKQSATSAGTANAATATGAPNQPISTNIKRHRALTAKHSSESANAKTGRMCFMYALYTAAVFWSTVFAEEFAFAEEEILDNKYKR